VALEKRIMVVCPPGSEKMAAVAHAASFSGQLVLGALGISSVAELYEKAEVFFRDAAAGARIFLHCAWPAIATAPVAIRSGYARQWPASSAVPLTPYAE
jgi:hypothetical protein